MLKGLLSDLERKSIEPICLNYSYPKNLRNMQFFMSGSGWDNESMLRAYQYEVRKAVDHRDAMLCGDGCDFPKKGNMSAGVARQYCGRLGKTENSQASVMLSIAGPNGYELLDYALYMPNRWFEEDYATRYQKCGVPDDVRFKTKNCLLSEMLHKAVKAGFHGRYVGVDSAFGRDHEFLDSLPPHLIYFADVPSDTLVFSSRPETSVPEYSGRGRRPTLAIPTARPRSVRELGEDGDVPWSDVVLGNGAKGPVIARDKCLRVVESRNGQPGKDVWLYMRRLEDGSIKYALCNESLDATIEAIRKPGLMRWSIEQCFNECKDYLGMDHYEVRTWQGWRRHILLVFIAHLFVGRLRRKFGARVDMPEPTPLVSAPVALSDYIKAIENINNNEVITHQNIHSSQKSLRFPLTIGIVIELICGMIPKSGKVMKNMDHKLKSAAASYASHARSKVASLSKQLD
jgi:SRSO17 transposase